MDPVTTAILAAIAAGATKVGEQVIVDAYAALKALLGKRFGSESKVVKAVDELEANPKSENRKGVLKEEVEAVEANKDPELVKLAQSLLTHVKELPGGPQIIQTATGDQNVQIAGDSNTVNTGPRQKKK